MTCFRSGRGSNYKKPARKAGLRIRSGLTPTGSPWKRFDQNYEVDTPKLNVVVTLNKVKNTGKKGVF
jgi:hypothetical protein